MEKQDREITILPDSRVFRFFSHLVFSLVFILQMSVYPLLFSFRVKGRRNLRNITHAVYVSNHCHYLDPGFTAAAVWPKKIYFTGLEKTFRIHGFSLFIRLLRSFPIPLREPGRIIKPIGRLLRDNRSCGIHFFPEGSLAFGSQEIRRFHNGAFSIAQFFQIPVIPIVEIQIQRKFLPPKIIMYIEEPYYISSFHANHDASDSKASEEYAFCRKACREAADHIFSIMQDRINLYH
jgi:1-acyl-sn-glycerol-3-phosphate acyltransferase